MLHELKTFRQHRILKKIVDSYLTRVSQEGYRLASAVRKNIL